MNRRLLLLSLLLSPVACAQPERLVPASPPDEVSVYVIPTDGIPEEFAANVARALTTDTGMWVKSSLLVPPTVTEPFAGANQYPAEDYLPVGAMLSKRLLDAGPTTYFIVLTERDINSRSRNFRFQYSMHDPTARTSVLSVARLLYTKEGAPAPIELVSARLQKMLMRIVGEMKLGWQRTTDPTDLMYAPIMSIEDVDRMSLVHTVQARGVKK